MYQDVVKVRRRCAMDPTTASTPCCSLALSCAMSRMHAYPGPWCLCAQVRTLRKGNFAGQLAQHFAESASRSSLDSKRRGSTDGRQSGVDRLRTIGSADIHQIMMDAHAPVAAPASPSGHR